MQFLRKIEIQQGNNIKRTSFFIDIIFLIILIIIYLILYFYINK